MDLKRGGTEKPEFIGPTYIRKRTNYMMASIMLPSKFGFIHLGTDRTIYAIKLRGRHVLLGIDTCVLNT